MTADQQNSQRPRNVFAQAAPIAWVIAVLMAIAMAWPDAQHLFIHKRYPATVGWPLLLATLALAILLSMPRLIPAQRVMACKLLSAGCCSLLSWLARLTPHSGLVC